MKCYGVTAIINRYLDDELDEISRQRVEQHLGQCDACERELTTLIKTVRVIRALEDLDPPRDYCLNSRCAGLSAPAPAKLTAFKKGVSQN